MKDRDILQLHANMIKDALPTIAKIEAVTEIRSQCKEAIKRQYFKPEEEAMLQTWFSDFLRTRQYLWYSIRDLQALLDNNYLNPTETQKPFLLVGFCAACLLVRIDFFLIKRVATHSIIQRKLNESVRSLKIPRKQFTEVFRSLSSIPNAVKKLGESNSGQVEKVLDEIAKSLATFVVNEKEMDQKGIDTENKIGKVLVKMSQALDGLSKKDIPAPNIKVVNEPMPNLDKILFMLSETIESGVVPLTYEVEKANRLDSDLERKLQDIYAFMKRLQAKYDSDKGEGK
jgi:hypothetical protein